MPTALLLPLLTVLRPHTRTPEDCFFALWDGYGDIPRTLTAQTRLSIPHRSYLLFRGRLADAGLWMPGEDRDRSCPVNSPHLMWPRDRTWFVATEVDQPWSAIAGSGALIDEVLAHPDLDAEPFLPSDRPAYWRA